MILQFSDTLNFLVIIIVMFLLAIAVAYMFKIQNLLVVLILFGMITIYLYLYGVISAVYGAVGFLVISIVSYMIAKMRSRNS